MGISKSAYRRYKVIDSMLRNKSRMYPSIEDIQEECFDRLDFMPKLNTLEKDIRNMKMSEPDGFDAPIVYCRQNRGYYYTNPNYSINGVSLTDKDVDSIKEALEILQNIGSSRVSDSFNYALDKILVSYKEEFPDSDSKRKIIETESIPGSRGFEHFDILFNACKNKTPLSFTHYSYIKRKFKSVIVHPVLLKEFDNFWYLLAYSENHKELRTFGFDRIYEPILLNKKFIPTPQDIVNNYYKDIYGVYPIKEQPKQEVKFIASALVSNYFEAYPIHESQNYTKKNIGTIFTIEVVPSHELVRLLRSYGNELNVTKPLWLNDMINNK
jgi:predicted DNA-binding transcriptional regulator YafY